jgi:hypothetical protein
MGWIDLASEQEQVAGSFEPSDSVKCGEFLNQLRTGYLLRKDSVQWS